MKTPVDGDLHHADGVDRDFIGGVVVSATFLGWTLVAPTRLGILAFGAGEGAPATNWGLAIALEMLVATE